MSNETTATPSTEQINAEMLEVLIKFSRMLPTPEGLGGHAPMEAFIQLGVEVRTVLAKATSGGPY